MKIIRFNIGKIKCSFSVQIVLKDYGLSIGFNYFKNVVGKHLFFNVQIWNRHLTLLIYKVLDVNLESKKLKSKE